MLQKALIVFFYVCVHFDCVNGGAAAFLLYVCGESECLGPAAGVLTLIRPVLEFGFLGVVAAVKELAAHELRLAHRALEGDQARPDLPVDVLPLNLLLIVHVLDEAVKVKEPVRHVLRDHLTMEVYKDLRIRTHHPLVLLCRVQLPAVDAATKECASLVLAIPLIAICDGSA